MIRKIIIAVIVSVGVIGVLTGIKVAQIRKMIAGAAAHAMPPETISSAVAKLEKWPTTLSAVGSVVAVRGVIVTPDIPGAVREIAFESGAVVKEGDLLVRLDTSAEEAQLRAIEAQVNLAKLNLERERTLRGQNMVSQSELDAAEATLNQAAASADAIRATIAKKTIRAPFAGRLGIRQVDLGQYLDTGKPIVSLQSLSPVFADFSLPQQELSKLSTGMRVRLTTDAYPGKEFEGKLTAINPDLDMVTRSVGLQATFENADQALRPGMFARMEVILPEERNVVVVPATSVLSAPYGDSVYVIESNSTNQSAKVVRQQFVKTGGSRGDFLIVESGLKDGEKVASAGIFKLRNGMSVVENNDLAPRASAVPRPPDS